MSATAVTHRDRTFDYEPRLVEANLNYLVRSIRPRAEMELPVYWLQGILLNQGAEGACVGFGWSGEASASPVRVKSVGNTSALGLYNRAKEIDEWEGVDYEGTSVRAGALVARERGYIESFYWCKTIDDIVRGLRSGPVVIGVEWREGMYDTDDRGLVDVSGNVVGGHCLYIDGYDPNYMRKGRHFRWMNSWGSQYGRRANALSNRRTGHGYIAADALESILFNAGGEACVPVGRKLAA
jgi:hypothetical protein